MLAAMAGQANVLEVLIEDGANVDATDADGKTALMSAVIMDSPEVIRALLARGAAVSARDAAGQTALGMARQFGRADVASLLEKAGGTA
jgi:ankyrin repeat protein